MIRFRCLHCGKSLKVSSKARPGVFVTCPRCKERSAVPAGFSSDGHSRRRDAEESFPKAESSEKSATTSGNQASSLLSGMGRKMRWAFRLVIGIGFLSVLLAIAAPRVPALAENADTLSSTAMILVPCSVILTLILLHAHGTGCPSCGRLWSRKKVETEFVDRVVVEKEGVPFARSTYRTIYECGSCQHRWSVNFTDEYKDFIGERPKRRLG